MIRIVMAAVLAFAAVLPAAPAMAQRARVFVASYGSDSNPCTFGSPCKTFQHAHDAVAPSGEITAIDSAGFGALTITKGLTITSPAGVEAGIAVPANSTGITINAQTGDIIILQGLTLEGANSGDNGILYNSGFGLVITGCTFRNFGNFGLNMTSVQSALTIFNTDFLNNGGALNVGSNITTLDHVNFSDNSDTIWYWNSNATVSSNLKISNSTFAEQGDGLILGGSASVPALVTLSNVHFNSSIVSILLHQYTQLWLTGVVDTNAYNGILVYEGENATLSTVYSDGTNHVTYTGTPPTINSWNSN